MQYVNKLMKLSGKELIKFLLSTAKSICIQNWDNLPLALSYGSTQISPPLKGQCCQPKEIQCVLPFKFCIKGSFLLPPNPSVKNCGKILVNSSSVFYSS